jgi:hypothetical protein
VAFKITDIASRDVTAKTEHTTTVLLMNATGSSFFTSRTPTARKPHIRKNLTTTITTENLAVLGLMPLNSLPTLILQI